MIDIMTQRKKYIVHVDMDAFFASVEQRDNPGFRNKPLIVGSDPKKGKGRGVVSAASYEARSFGIHSALPISMAYNRCPRGIFVRPQMDKYTEESRKIFSILMDFSPDVEPISVDEAFLDITGSYHFWETPENTCKAIKKAIKEKTKLAASLGLAPNKMTAKIASDLKKPDGLVIVREENLLDFLHTLPVEKLWGVGDKTLKVLHRNGIKKIGDIAQKTPKLLESLLGKNGIGLWQLANGKDQRPVKAKDDKKSIGHEYTFNKDTSDKEKILNVLMHLAEKISRRLRDNELTGKTITLKLRLKSFETFTRSITLKQYSSHVDDIYKAASEKFEELESKNTEVRLLGIRVSNLEDSRKKTDLFFNSSSKQQKRERIHKAIDKLAEKYGPEAIKRRIF